jgi:hypothetical protein
MKFTFIQQSYKMEDLKMKKLLVLSIVVAFAVLGAQAFASPPVAPPVEGFIIDSFTEIKCDGDVTESEIYNWQYFEGVGNIKAVTGTCPTCPAITNAILTLGFQKARKLPISRTLRPLMGPRTSQRHSRPFHTPPRLFRTT